MKSQVAADYKKLSDEELIHRYVHKQDQYAVNFLFERYGHLVFGICSKYNRSIDGAKNAAQEIFIKMLEDAAKVKKIEDYKSWLFQLAKDFCISKYGKGSGQNSVTIRKHHLRSDIPVEQLQAAVGSLNKEERQCMELFYLEGMNYSAISKKTGKTVQEVTSLLQRGKNNIVNKFEVAEED